MRLQTKFILWVAAVMVVTTALGGWCWESLHEEQFEAAARRETDRAHAFLDAVRAQARDAQRRAPADDPLASPECATAAVRGVFDRLAREHPGYQHKDASDNPLNEADRPDALEARLLGRLRGDPAQPKVMTLARDDGGREWAVGAKAIVATESCLKCHGPVAAAPAGVVARFGSTHGYGWRAGTVVGAQVVRLETSAMRAAQAGVARKTAMWVAVLFMAALIVVYLAAKHFVCIPVERMGSRMRQIADSANCEGELDGAARRDELGVCAVAFNQVLAVVRKSLGALRDANENLEARVAERTSEIARSNAEIIAIRDTALDCIITMDHRGRIASFNPAAERTFRLNRDRVIGRELAEVMVPPAHRSQHREALHEYLSSGKGNILGKRIEVTALRGDGTTFPVEIAVNVLRTDGPPSFVAYLRDITDRKRAEASARQAEKLALVAARTDNAVIITDAQGRIEWVNEGFTRISEYAPAEVRGRKPGSFLQGPETDPATVAMIREQLRLGNGFRAEILNYGKSGRKYWLAIEVQPIRDSAGQVRNFIAIESDVTQRKATEADLKHAKEAAESANKAKSEFLANMSHEIRTPLNGVIGMLELVEGTALAPSQRRFVQTAQQSAGTLLALINDILDFSKIEAGKLELSRVDFDLNEVVEEVMAMLAPRAGKKGLELAYQIDPGLPTAVRGDPDRLRQVIVNLATNAIKFTERGDVMIRVSPEAAGAGEPADPPSVTIRCEVMDSGIGIPPDRMDRLFRSFSQVDASTTRKYGGTGLGLAISKQLAELMGGRIGVHSEEGHGSTFWFTARLGRQPQAATPVRRLPGDLGGLRVLAVDDNAKHGKILQQVLTSWGFNASVAGGAAEAQAAMSQAEAAGRPYRLAVIDMLMPGTSGLDLGRAIRAGRGRADVPMILMAPVQGQLDEPKLKEAGFSGYVTKPVRQSHLFDAIIEAMASGPAALVATPSDAVATFAEAIDDETTAAPAQAPAAHVLLAEDNEVNQMVAAEVLARGGFTCDIVPDGRKAVDAVAARPYDVVLMDCQMPLMDGFDATRAIRLGEAASGRHVPIIALTANAIQGDRERCLAAGMDDYIPKPLDARKLIALIRSIVDKARAIAVTETSTPPASGPAAEIVVPGAPIDWDSLLERCMKDVKFVGRMLGKFQAQATDSLAKIEQSFGGGDAAETVRLAHSLKGAAAYLSAGGVQQTAAKIEELGRAGTLDGVEQWLNVLRDEVRRCTDYIPTLMAERAVPGAGAR